jgi:short-subunit dehydrogenase
MPNAAVYTGSKHFVRAFTESLRAQLAGTGVVVSEAAPGPVESEFDQVAGIEGGATPGQGVLRITAQKCAADIVRGGSLVMSSFADGIVRPSNLHAIWVRAQSFRFTSGCLTGWS